MSLVWNEETKKCEIPQFAEKVRQARHRLNDPYYYSISEARDCVVREELFEEVRQARIQNGLSAPQLAVERLCKVFEFLLTEGRL